MTRRRSLPRKIGGADNFTKRHKEIFLKVFSECNSVKKAALAVGFNPTTIYNHLHKDEEFYNQFQKANEAVLDKLEEEAFRRAVTGIKEPIYYQGVLVGYKTVYSDKLLEMLLRGRSDKYSNKSKLEIEGQVDVNVNDVKQKLLDKALSRGLILDQEPEEADFEEIPQDEEPEEDQGEDDESL